jgi:hypothetical protein
MEFGAVIGNPPYQISDGGAQASAKPIYQHFVLLGKEMTSDYSCYITPTRWFAGGKGLDEFRDIMLNDNTIIELHDFLTPEDVFPNTNNRGGVCYFINDKSKDVRNVEVVTYQNNSVISKDKRPLLMDGMDIFIRDNFGVSIIQKILGYKDVVFIDEYISARKPFGVESNIIKTEKFKTDFKQLKNPVKCIGRNKIEGFIEEKDILSNTEYIDKWKVYVPRANNIGTELGDDNLNAFVGGPGSICTEAYIVVGADLQLTEDSAFNLTMYLQTKFARYMHSQAKASHDASRKTYRFIPLQNFTKNSDIYWDKSIDEIDEQLFKKYELSEEERKHIKKSIKEM